MGLIPTAPKVTGRDPALAKLMLMGPPKHGKTTTATHTGKGDTLLIPTEAGYETIPGILAAGNGATPIIRSWREFLAVLEEVKSHDKIRRIVIDTFSRIVRYCQQHVCKELDIQTLGGQKDFGRSWEVYNSTLDVGMEKLKALGRQIVFIAHTKESTHKVDGVEVTQVRVDLPAAAGRFVLAEVDASMYVQKEEDPSTMKRRVRVYFQPTNELEIGGRYLPGVEIPNYIELPDITKSQEPTWPCVEKVLRKGFVPESVHLPANGASTPAAPKRKFVFKAKV